MPVRIRNPSWTAPVNVPQQLDALADKIADRLLQRPNFPPVLVRRRDISYMLGNSGRSSATDRVINDPTFPPPVCVTENGVKKWRFEDVKRWVDKYFEKQAKITFLALRERQRLIS